jgi:hypothetical protein
MEIECYYGNLGNVNLLHKGNMRGYVEVLPSTAMKLIPYFNKIKVHNMKNIGYMRL